MKELNLGSNDIGDRGMRYLCAGLAALAEEGNLTDLDLADCRLTDKGCVMLADLLKQHKGIVSLNLAGNLITDAGALIIRRAMRANKALDTVELEGNDVSEGMMESIRDENLCGTPPPPIKIAPIVDVSRGVNTGDHG